MATAKKVRKPSRAAKMREYFTANPLATPSEVAKKFKTTYQIAYMAKKLMEENAVKAKPTLWQPPELLPVPPITMEEPQADPVNHPAHYKVGGMETIDFIEAKGLTYHLGNAVKYISRADHKGNRKQDLEKAKWYLERAIAQA
jgi:hypothetical protein